jgi:2-succinyl-5-enolpyruvyl-6-hydroxy-3-cyclohexene-1-carboxylate synthase
VLHLGGRALSKRLEQFIADARPNPYVVVRENPFRLDPNHRVTQSIEAGIEGFCEALVKAAARRPKAVSGSWKESWVEASEGLEKSLERLVEGEKKLNEPLVARFVSRHIPEGQGLVLASSMPVRDVDTFAAVDGAPVPVIANRGASGIDGTVATAAGVARGLGKPVTLLIGDLALLHDLNSLSMLRGLPVIVVALNNDGGGIFSFLPVAQHEKFFEPYFGTPHGLGFEEAAAMFSLDYERPRSVAGFTETYGAAGSRETPTLIEVKTDRRENVALHRELLKESTAD